jgi:plasmid maintenance system killer protein
MLDAAETLANLLVPPGNRLEKLTGDRAAFGSGPAEKRRLAR